ncbi:MAG: methionine--tRNA ligase [Planctomycetes bacterium]|nr:methionine--tRNA ligase [Planctomycetota bacterium]
MTRYLVTSALPYANGPIHFGHIAGAYLPADVYVRYLKMAKGKENVLYVCGTDEHGVAITMKAEAEGSDYRAYVDKWHKEIRNLFTNFSIDFDIFSGTARCDFHKQASQKFFSVLHDNNFIIKRTEKQWFSEQSQRFLPDRYLQGECPDCSFETARGDECPKCGSWIDAQKLKNPVSLIDGSKPILKDTTHWYIDLPALQEAGLKDWYAGNSADHPIKGWKSNVDGYVQAMLRDLHDRPITRDLPWGVPLPEGIDDAEGKVLYVWFDAPIGYISATMEWASNNDKPDSWKDWWQNKDTRLVHFIGKDNIAFHTVVFPSMLLGQGKTWDGNEFVLPWSVPANEFYNLQGKKFNTSDGWYIDNDSFFESYNPDAARFHVLLSAPETSDSEFNWNEFQATNNSLLADKIGNLVSRVLKFADKRFDNKVPAVDSVLQDEFLDAARDSFGQIGAFIENHELRKAALALISACSSLNQFFDKLEPWKKIKSDDPSDQMLCAQAIERCIAHFDLLSRRLAPFCPRSAEKLSLMLGDALCSTESLWGPDEVSETVAAGAELGSTEVLFAKIDNDAIVFEIEKLGSK